MLAIMAVVPITEAAHLLGKPERTVRRWCARGRLPATRTPDGWLVELELNEAGQVADTGQANGHSLGHMATIPVTFLADLTAKAETAAYWQGRAEVLAAQLEQMRALPEPQLTPAPSVGSPHDGTRKVALWAKLVPWLR